MSDYSTTICRMEEEKSTRSLENQGFCERKHIVDNVDKSTCGLTFPDSVSGIYGNQGD